MTRSRFRFPARGDSWHNDWVLTRLLVLCLAVALCARVARAQDFSAEEIDRESLRMAGLALDRLLENTARVMRVGDPIRIAASPYCGGQVGAVLGVFTLNKDTLGNLFDVDAEFKTYMQRAATARYPLDARERVFLVVPGLPGEKAGLRPGDLVTGVLGHSLTRRDNLRALRVHGEESVKVAVERDGSPLELSAETRLGCAYPAQAWFGYEINAFAGHMGRESGSYVLEGMLDFAPVDDDLAIVLGHELGHLILYSGGTRRTEADADYMGLYATSLAGFDASRAPEFWDRMGHAIPYTNLALGFYSHPSSSARSAALRATLAEIERKRAAGQPLDPGDVSSRQYSTDDPADSDPEMRAGALAVLQEKRERLLRVSHQLRTRGVALCGDKTAPVLGAAVARRRDAITGHEAEAEQIFGLVDEVKVLAVLPDSPAASAGVRTGDLVLQVDGQDISRTEEVFQSLRKARDQPPKLVLSRSGERVEVTLPLLLGCSEEFMLSMSGEVDLKPARNGDDLFVPEGAIRFARDDDELALLLAHSIAHDLQDTSGLADFSTEPAADVLGMRIAARAGFDASKAPALLDRLAAENPMKLNPKKSWFRTLHGNIAARSLAVKGELAKLESAPKGDALP
jgi:membrane-associated protease RseP (regulator of RpoE activity)